MRKKTLILLMATGIIFLFSGLMGWNDEVLFTGGDASYSIMKPNVMILMDNSGSMNNLIYHPDYDSNQSYTNLSDGIWGGTTTHYIRYYHKGTYYSYLEGKNVHFAKGYYFGTGSYSHIYPVTAVSGFEGVYELDIRDYPYNNAHPNGHPIYLFAEQDSGNNVRMQGNFLNFMEYDATAQQRAEWNHFMKYGVWDTTDTTNYDGDHGMDRKVRMRVARKVMKNTVDDIYDEYDADTNPDKTGPRLGISRFNSDEGGSIIQPCQQKSSRNATKVLIGGIEGNTWTPLSESYAELWAYFRNGGETSITDDKYFLPLDNPGAQNISSNTPITNWCQLNFILVVTDGEPTQDVQLRDLSSESLFYIPDDNSAPWGDVDGVGNDDDTATLTSNGTNYLDDLAYFAYNNDLWPDDIPAVQNDSRFETAMKNKQFIYTYTIGFSIDNTLLKDTAANGGGEYFTAKDYDELSTAMKNVFASIDEKVRAFAAFAAPKYSLTYGDRSGYVATFVPKSTQTIWEGHLKSYKLDLNGDFPDLENPGSSLEWDAGEVLNSRVAARNIYTYKNGSLVPFTTGNIEASDLGFVSGDTTADNDNRDAVVDFIRGNNGYNWKLGDIFHFNPTVVGAPLKWKASFDPSYKLFFDHYTEIVQVDGKDKLVSKRTEVVYVGANDGSLHCFRVSDGEELWAFIPPSLLPKLRDIVPGVPVNPGVIPNHHQYFIDGKALVKDIKISDTLNWTSWKTVLTFGYGEGGTSYCTIDVTDPASPVFLYEFSDPALSGFSEGKPIIARLANDGNDNQFPALILPGGYDIKEEPVSTPNLVGKAFFILNAYTGDLVKVFKWGNSISNFKSGGIYYNTNPGFKYAFAATPAALDYNNDGLTDYLYLTESGDYRGTANEGGRIWRVSTSGEPNNWLPTNIFQAENGQTMFLPPTLGYDKSYNLWVLFGTGHRPQPNNEDNLTGQFISFIDSLSSSSVISISDLTDTNAAFATPPGDVSTITKGIWFDFVNGTGEMTFEPYPIFINNTVYFNTYTPTQAGKAIDPCNPQGNQNIYQFKLIGSSGQSLMTDTGVSSGKIQGSGLLSGGKYKIYKGSGVVGGTDVIEQKTINIESVFGSMSWEEEKR